MDDAVYVVQVQTEEEGVWHDIDTVTVPARTHRKTVIAKALEQAGYPSDMLTVRVLDAESARTSQASMRQPDPVLEIE